MLIHGFYFKKIMVFRIKKILQKVKQIIITRMQGNAHIISLFMNIWLCKKIRAKIQTEVVQKEKIGMRAYVIYVVSVILLIGANQALFLMTEKPNLYQQIECPRSYSLSQVKAYGDELKIKTMQMENVSLHARMAGIAKLQEVINILSHPARRLSYDAFGETSTQYAWAFTSQQFLLQVVISSAIFYIICTVMSLINARKAQIKTTLKTQILVMILLFVWEIDIIMTTQSKLHTNYSDFWDHFYFALPLFERRQMLKSILIPAMNMVDIFIVFFVKNNEVEKIKKLGMNPQLRVITNSVSSSISIDKINPAQIDECVGAGIQSEKSKDGFKAEVFRLNREILKCLFFLNLKAILPTPQIRRINSYFKLPFLFETKNIQAQ